MNPPIKKQSSLGKWVVIGRLALLILLITIAGGCRQPTIKEHTLRPRTPAGPQSPASQLTQPGEIATVTHVVDGDTIEVRFPDGRRDRVRYIGIDAWETWDRRRGDHGTNANRALVEGKQVSMAKDVSDRDRFGRLLRYVYLGDIFVNARLIAEGHARAKDFPPDSAQAAYLARLQRQAKNNQRGCFAGQGR